MAADMGIATQLLKTIENLLLGMSGVISPIERGPSQNTVVALK
jgi:hypothetical protein